MKPTRPDITTNLVINTDRRTYHPRAALDREDLHGFRLLAVSGRPAHCARRQNQEPRRPRRSQGNRSRPRHFRYAIPGDNPALAAAARLRRWPEVYIEFPRASPRARCRRCSSSGLPAARTRQLPRRGNYYIVDRLFAAAELRLGDKDSERRVRIVRSRWKAALMVTESEEEDAASSVAPPDLRLRGEPPRVTRLSRKVLIGLGGASRSRSRGAGLRASAAGQISER